MRDMDGSSPIMEFVVVISGSKYGRDSTRVLGRVRASTREKAIERAAEALRVGRLRLSHEQEP